MMVCLKEVGATDISLETVNFDAAQESVLESIHECPCLRCLEVAIYHPAGTFMTILLVYNEKGWFTHTKDPRGYYDPLLEQENWAYSHEGPFQDIKMAIQFIPCLVRQRMEDLQSIIDEWDEVVGAFKKNSDWGADLLSDIELDQAFRDGSVVLHPIEQKRVDDTVSFIEGILTGGGLSRTATE